MAAKMLKMKINGLDQSGSSLSSWTKKRNCPVVRERIAKYRAERVAGVKLGLQVIQVIVPEIWQL
jgi:hypothetical protein